MLIWILALVLFAVFAAIGFYKGAIRMGVSFVGFLLGAFLALPLGKTIAPLFPKMGLTNPVWNQLWPPLTVFLVFVAIFVGLSFYLHRVADLHFKYRSDDFGYNQFQRFNQRLGICVGVAIGGAHLLLLSAIIYCFGYLSVQVSPEEGAPPLVNILNQARQGLQSTGLDRLAAKLDPMPETFYKASDVLGLIYHNPDVEQRLSNYPAYLGLGERPEIQEMLGDNDFMGVLKGRPDLLTLINHPRTQTLVGNQELLDLLRGVDLTDLRAYLETGKSTKYDSERILGRWILDPWSTFMGERRRRPEMPADEMKRLKTIISIVGQNTTLKVVPDNKLYLKVELNDQAKQALQLAVEGPKPAQTNQTDEAQGNEAPQMSPEIAQRYGLTRGAAGRGGGRGMRAAPVQPIIVPRAAAPAPKVLPPTPYALASSQGTWQSSTGKYQIEFQEEKGAKKAVGVADEDILTVSIGDARLVFLRVL